METFSARSNLPWEEMCLFLATRQFFVSGDSASDITLNYMIEHPGKNLTLKVFVE
jgi:hypothetical protein